MTGQWHHTQALQFDSIHRSPQIAMSGHRYPQVGTSGQKNWRAPWWCPSAYLQPITQPGTRKAPQRGGRLASESKLQGKFAGCDCSNYQLFRYSFWVGFYRAVRRLNHWLLTIYRGKRIILTKQKKHSIQPFLLQNTQQKGYFWRNFAKIIQIY